MEAPDLSGVSGAVRGLSFWGSGSWQQIGSEGPLFLERNNGSWRLLRERTEVELRDPARALDDVPSRLNADHLHPAFALLGDRANGQVSEEGVVPVHLVPTRQILTMGSPFEKDMRPRPRRCTPLQGTRVTGRGSSERLAEKDLLFPLNAVVHHRTMRFLALVLAVGSALRGHIFRGTYLTRFLLESA